MITDLLGAQVHAAVDSLPSSLPHVQSGSLRALAVTTKDRSDMLRDVPTVDESPGGRPLAMRIFVSGVNAASMRALNWAAAVGRRDFERS